MESKSSKPRLSLKPAPDIDYMREVLHYDRTTGIFVWRRRTGGKAAAGRRAGCVTPNGYRVIAIKNVLYMAHRLAWLYEHEEWPEADVDHINGDRDDNRIANLRPITRSGNNENIRGPRSDNRSGLLGARLTPSGTYYAYITVRGVGRYLGTFPTAQEAHEAYMGAKRKHHEANTL
jgi:hypothetical protein